MHEFRWVLVSGLAALLVACSEPPPQILGTLEYDRISLPAPAAERIVSVAAREGDRVATGATILTLESTRAAALTDSALAQARQQRELLGELEAGTRDEQVAQAGAQLAGARARAREARAAVERVQALDQRHLVSATELDRAQAAVESADAQVRASAALLDELQRGARKERVAQALSAVEAADAQALAQAATRDKLTVVAPRDGRIDSLPYKLGDQAPIGAPLAILLVGEAPYARVYVPAPLRLHLKIGSHAVVHVDGLDKPLSAQVRAIRSEPSFTPYYALSGKDAARLSYLAELVFDDAEMERARDLPAGLPVRVELVPP